MPTPKNSKTVKPAPPSRLQPKRNSRINPLKVNPYLLWGIFIITAVLAYTMIWISYWYKSGAEEPTPSVNLNRSNLNTNTVKNTNSAINANSNAAINANTNINSSVSTNTATWSEYENEQFGYTLKYPDDWAEANTADANPAMFADPVALAQETDTTLQQGAKFEVQVENSSASTLTSAVADKDSEWTVLKDVLTTIDGVSALRRQLTAMTYTLTTYVLKNNKLYSITQYIPKAEDRGKYTAIYDQILANFQFTQ